MRAFVEIVDQGSLTAAGTAHGRSLPTMVRILAALEAELGATLLKRTTRRMSLTEEGRVYLERCRRILADVAEAEALVGEGEEAGDLRGPLRVTSPVVFGQMHVAPLLIEFSKEHPLVRVELVLLDRIVDLIEEGLDVAVRIALLPDSSLIATTVGRVRRVIVASPELLGRLGVPESPTQLKALPCIEFEGLGPGRTWRFRSGTREIAVPVSGSFVTNQVVAALAACEAGLGFGAFLSYQVEPALRAGRLKEVLSAFEPRALPVSLVHPEARLMTSRLRRLLDWMKPRLRERLREQPGSSTSSPAPTKTSSRRSSSGTSRS